MIYTSKKVIIKKYHTVMSNVYDYDIITMINKLYMKALSDNSKRDNIVECFKALNNIK